SPLLMNIALHGMEAAAGCRYIEYPSKDRTAAAGTPILIRYADDFVVLCHTKEEAQSVQEVLKEWLEPRGLKFNQEKTRITHVADGFDFLGFTIQRRGRITLASPSKDAVSRMRTRLRGEIKSLYGANAAAITRRMNPIVRGWAAYYRGGTSSAAFNSLDMYMWQLTWKWANRSHPMKSKKWVAARYFGRFHKDRQDKWVFGDRETGAYLTKFRWIKIQRHVMVKGRASPDDPNLIEYWANRRHKTAPPPMGKTSIALAVRQKGLCPVCRQALIAGAEYEPDDLRQWVDWFTASGKMLNKHHLVYRRDGGTDERKNLRLIHSSCHRLHHAGDARRDRKGGKPPRWG
ncbi:group II intron maturase-specific domain-containing protein, partial [Streptomyces sp. NPDC005774]|uniref:group II intron maturase-specific domain-containing protein n=1 Tax=Streptomyces sp. NPDC005774 TaxID=3364728 RepID=UPI0036B967F3